MDEEAIDRDDAERDAPVGGCAVHGLALLLTSVAAVILMLGMTFACWVLYGLIS